MLKPESVMGNAQIIRNIPGERCCNGWKEAVAMGVKAKNEAEAAPKAVLKLPDPGLTAR
jgi:hypothetical protein